LLTFIVIINALINVLILFFDVKHVYGDITALLAQFRFHILFTSIHSWRYTWSDSNVILCTKVTAAVYYVGRRQLGAYLDVRFFTYLHFNPLLFVHNKYTSNMAAWFYVKFNDVAAPDV